MRRLRLGWPTPPPPRLVADALAGHSAVALALGALIYLVCLTGALCVFIDELQLWEAPSPSPSAFHPVDADRLVAEAVQRAGGWARAPLVYLRAPATPRQRTVVSIGARQWSVDSAGRLTPLRLPWSDFLARLHYTLTLPAPWGEALVGVLGVGLSSLLLSGVLAHPRILRDAFVLRLGGARRLQEADLHNRLGVWGLPFHLAVSLSGALFGLANVLTLVVATLGFHGDAARAVQALRGPAVAADPRPAPVPPLAPLIARARALQPGSRLSYLAVERGGARAAQVSVEVTAPGRLPRGEQAYFDARGRMTGRGRFASGALGLQLYSGAAQVHFGFFGGLAVRLAYGVLGLALCWVCAGGTSIWLARRRDRGRAAPRLEHAWSAVVWGAPLALAVAAWPTAPPALSFWAALALALTASQAPPLTRRSERAVDRLYRLVLAAALLLAAALRATQAIPSATALAIEAVAVLTALGLIFSARDVIRLRSSY